jgi:hypothetical protein
VWHGRYVVGADGRYGFWLISLITPMWRSRFLRWFFKLDEVKPAVLCGRSMREEEKYEELPV